MIAHTRSFKFPNEYTWLCVSFAAFLNMLLSHKLKFLEAFSGRTTLSICTVLLISYIISFSITPSIYMCNVICNCLIIFLP